MLELKMPFKDNIKSLKAGDIVYITGELLVMRDAAHKRLFEMLKKGEQIPFDFKDKLIYFWGLARRNPVMPKALRVLLPPSVWTCILPLLWIWAYSVLSEREAGMKM
jgi:tartrate dehydratase beta subunit/fumarate hydratase class I family protein